MKLIDGKGAVLGRLASYVAKQALRGEDVVILNCEKVIITGNKKDIQDKFREKRTKVGSGQKGPKHSRNPERIVKRTIRGMLPNHRRGRGKQALKKIMCYNGIPREFENEKKIVAGKEKKFKHIDVKEIFQWRK